MMTMTVHVEMCMYNLHLLNSKYIYIFVFMYVGHKKIIIQVYVRVIILFFSIGFV